MIISSSSKCADRIEISSRFAKMLEMTKANEVPNSSNVNCISINPLAYHVTAWDRQLHN